MKVIQPFFLGGAGGLALALAIAIGLFLSPLRKSLYLDLDPEISDLRSRMDRIQERLLADEMGIAEAAASGGQPADSLKAAQAGSWKEYRHWRNRVGDISRAHDRATPAGFASWAYSLRGWFFPAAALLALLPGLLLAVRAARRPRGTRPSRNPVPAATAEAKAFSSFQSAVQQVARIAAAENPAHAPEPSAPDRSPASRKPTAAAPRSKGREPAGRLEAVEKETEYLPEVPKRIAVVPPPVEPPSQREVAEAADPIDSPYQDASPYEVGPGNVFREPETAEIPMTDPPTPSGRPAGLETQILNLGPGWGESHRPPMDEGAGASRAGNPPGLSMQDEDVAEPEDSEEPPSGAFMPPTTEVERVERRKAEVLKLARKGLTSSEISRRMRISQDQVEFIIRMRREKG